MKLFLLFAFLFSSIAYSETFIRTIEYPVSPDMSRNQATQAALQQIKLELLSEIGVYVESEINITQEHNKNIFTQTSNVLTLGKIQTKILNTVFNGEKLFLEVEANVDKNEVLDLIDTKYKYNELDNKLTKALQNLSNFKRTEDESAKLIRKINFLEQQLKLAKEYTSSNNISELLLHEVQSEFNSLRQSIINRLDSEKKSVEQKLKLATKSYIKGMLLQEFEQLSKLKLKGKAIGYGNSSDYGFVTEAICLDYLCKKTLADKQQGRIIANAHKIEKLHSISGEVYYFVILVNPQSNVVLGFSYMQEHTYKNSTFYNANSPSEKAKNTERISFIKSLL